VTPRERWTAFDRPYAPRLAVEGGVRVAKPGSVSTHEATRLVALLDRRTTSGIASRARTYARAGQVVEVRIVDGTASAAIQGSDAEPYAVALGHEDGGVEATCSCPYGCDAVDWCKHAAALAYVVAHLVETDPSMAAGWLGQPPVPDRTDRAPDAEAVAAEGADAQVLAALVARLRTRRPAVDGGAQWAAAIEVLPLP
jgi:uncharacterized Zn finger protein